jgi:hypothetical protein
VEPLEEGIHLIFNLSVHLEKRMFFNIQILVLLCHSHARSVCNQVFPFRSAEELLVCCEIQFTDHIWVVFIVNQPLPTLEQSHVLVVQIIEAQSLAEHTFVDRLCEVAVKKLLITHCLSHHAAYKLKEG